MRRAIILKMLFTLSVLTLGCDSKQELMSSLDKLVFTGIGGTLFSHPATVGIKEIHFEAASLKGREIVIEGKVVQFGKNSTFMLVADDEARVLVVLTGVADFQQKSLQGDGSVVRVLGVVDNAQKGLPFVEARAIKVVDAAVLPIQLGADAYGIPNTKTAVAGG